MLNISSECIEFESVMRKNGFPDNHLRKGRKVTICGKTQSQHFKGGF